MPAMSFERFKGQANSCQPRAFKWFKR